MVWSPPHPPTGSRHTSFSSLAPRLSCPAACEIFPNKGLTGVPALAGIFLSTGMPGKPSTWVFSCGMWDLTPCQGSSPGPLHCCCCCSVTKLCPTLCHPTDCSTPAFLVLRYLPEFAQTHVHWVSDAIQPSHPLLSPSFAFSLSQHQGLLYLVSSSHQVAEVMELQFQHQSFQGIFRVDFL